ncbi:MAG TPA: metallophosphoesterase family protein [Gaiellaceae bacterium]|nr:metallophosphoesterase family protein [Gaiellaceae bacterium]
MRVAALYDVHGMVWALEAVLRDLDADAVVFGGDIVAGPAPRATLELVRSLDNAVCIRGNAERDPQDWLLERLSSDDVEWCKSLPLTAELGGVLYCHATPTDDLPITTIFTPDDAVRANFAGVSGTVVIGHTHHQFDRRVGDVRVVNAGSVGMPYESHVAAYWLEVVDGEPRFRSTEVDVDALASGILASGWPGAEEFVAENVRTAVDRDEAARYFESRR